MAIMRVIIGILLTCWLATPAWAQDWTQWRGPSRDGVVASNALPVTWPTTVAPAWRVDIGEGYASPVIAGGRVFAHSRRDPDEVVTAVDLESGKVLWQKTYAAPFAKNQYAVQMAKGPNSTPLVVGGLVFTLGTSGVLSAWQAGDGTLAWRNDYSSMIDTSKLFCGTAMSPVLEGGAVIVQVGSDVHGGRILALDPKSGKERWSWKGPGPGYASPVIITAAGSRQLVTLTNRSIVGLDVSSGAEQWSADFTDEFHENIISPLWTGTHLIVSGVRQGTQAYSIDKTDKGWRATQAWKNAEVTMYMSAPVLSEGTIYGISNKRKGQFVALDANTGKVQWATEGREGEHSSILLTPAHVLFLTNGGDLVVARKDATRFAEERRIEVAAGETWAVPIFIPGGLIVREAGALTRLKWAN